MQNLSASVAVMDAGKILLIQREDLEVWALPGGGVDSGETVAQAAAREVFEETGIQVELTGMVGIYSSTKWHHGGDHAVLFTGTPKTHHLQPCPNEVLDLGYFSISQLPEPLIWWHRQRILDAVEGKRGIARLQDKIWPFEPDQRMDDCREMLKTSTQSRPEFYHKHFGQIGPDGQQLEVE
ncbi:MAG: NUDIX domain-containing protein [bacterium]|nr:NUDIX domain-containing protein [bacterium]